MKIDPRRFSLRNGVVPQTSPFDRHEDEGPEGLNEEAAHAADITPLIGGFSASREARRLKPFTVYLTTSPPLLTRLIHATSHLLTSPGITMLEAPIRVCNSKYSTFSDPVGIYYRNISI